MSLQQRDCGHLGSLTGTCPTGGGGSYEPTSDEVFGVLVDAPLDVILAESKDDEGGSEESPEKGQWVDTVSVTSSEFSVDGDENAKLDEDLTSETSWYESSNPFDGAGADSNGDGIWDGWDSGSNSVWGAIVENNPNEFNGLAWWAEVLTDYVTTVPWTSIGTGAVAGGFRAKVALHGAHHAFDGQKLRHLQITTRMKGVKGSHWIKRFPFRWPPWESPPGPTPWR